MPGSSFIVNEDPGIAFNLRAANTRTERTDEDRAPEGGAPEGGALLEGQECFNIVPPLRLHQ